MNFTTLNYYLFLPISVILYYLFKPKYRNFILLVLSYFFYATWNLSYSLLILTSTIITYVSAILVSKQALGKKKLWLFFSLLINLSILFFFKYYNFTAGLINDFTRFNSPSLSILLPVGISFYTFQAIGYTIDVYRNDVKPERNFIDYALFVSFFPQLVAGPIERSTKLIPQIKSRPKFKLANLRDGFLPILTGLFRKIVIADRLAVIVNTVYNNSGSGYFNGLHYIIATVAFAFQIYCDFSAYSDIARGSAKFFGIDLVINFKAPYLADSIKDFWRRWHISLSTWFKDYLYFPLGGNRVSKFRVALNILIVFVVSGLWHGAALTFIVWGALNGVYQVIGLGFRQIKFKRLMFFKPFKVLITFALICFSWIFFRAESITQATYISREVFSLNADMFRYFDYSLLGLSREFLIICIISVAFLMIAGFINEFTDLERFVNKTFFPRYAIYFVLICIIILFGYYGVGYDPQDFIYFRF